ncbi:MAG: IS3 family transposase [Solobacterium sp.]|jgi:transposase InsO family protein|nr:IS3 family transposase [Solobacterium sp.]
MAYNQIHRSDNPFSKAAVFRIFHISSTGYYNWEFRHEDRDGKRKAKEAADDVIKHKMTEVIRELNFVPGRRLFHVNLWRKGGIVVSVKKIRKLMREMNLIPCSSEKDAYKGQASHFHECDAKQNLVARKFGDRPRTVILTDITYLYYGTGRTVCYLCVFKDAYTREVLGYALSRHMNVALVVEAYTMMMDRHGKELHRPDVLVHSDQGSQYLSTTFQELLKNDGLIQSMSRRGNSQDNAPMESFFGRMKNEILTLIARCRDFDTVLRMITGYMESYNKVRCQYDLAGLAPAEFYQYSTTGIYPLDNYYGVKSTELLSVDQLVKERLLRRQKKQEENRKQDCATQQLSPFHVLSRDEKKIMSEIRKWEKSEQISSNQLKKLKSLLERVKTAVQFLSENRKTDSTLEETLKDPQAWKNCPPFDYVTDLGAIY